MFLINDKLKKLKRFFYYLLLLLFISIISFIIYNKIINLSTINTDSIQYDKTSSTLQNIQYTKKTSIISNNKKDIVNIAASQIGKHDGKKYWKWYGYREQVDWCACFVSWCADKCNLIDEEIIPKFSSCNNEGIPWFKEKHLWVSDKKYIPKKR